VIKSEGIVTSLCAVTKVSRNARNLLPQFLAELGDDGVREDQRKLGYILIDRQERVNHIVRRKNALQIALSISSRIP
jgi:hypothetical protein